MSDDTCLCGCASKPKAESDVCSCGRFRRKGETGTEGRDVHPM